MPSHQDNLAAVRAAAIAANPEIAELKFGCLVRVTNLNGKKSVWELIGDVDVHSNQDRIWRNVDSEFATVEWGNFKLELLDGGTEVEVLGREITLPDVLLALGEGYALDGKGELMRQTWREPCSFDTKFLEIRLDLRANLSGQSEETVAYLANLLK